MNRVINISLASHWNIRMRIKNDSNVMLDIWFYTTLTLSLTVKILSDKPMSDTRPKVRVQPNSYSCAHHIPRQPEKYRVSMITGCVLTWNVPIKKHIIEQTYLPWEQVHLLAAIQIDEKFQMVSFPVRGMKWIVIQNNHMQIRNGL